METNLQLLHIKEQTIVNLQKYHLFL